MDELIAGRYRLKHRIGSGGTADVYEADDITLRRVVALKLLHERVTEDEVLRARLKAEVGISRTLTHPGIVEVVDYSPVAPAYLAMEYMAGGDLRKRLLEVGELPATEVERIAGQLLRALVYAHEKGVVHRDLKPRNVLFGADGSAKVADFGLARSVSAAGLFQEGTIAGTPEYTAPESITASLWDARSDLYALGCTLYEAMTGAPPFTANTPAEVLRLQVEAEVPTLSSSDSRVSALVGLLLQKDPNRRPQTATEALEHVINDDSRIVIPLASERTCPTCGTLISDEYPWCFTCRRAAVPAIQERPGYTVLVVGPGKRGEKISPDLRDASCRITRLAGLDPANMEKALPRLPFVLAKSVDYGGAKRIQSEMSQAGAEVVVHGQGEESRAKLAKAVLRKVMVMTPRFYLVALGMGGAWFNIARSSPGVIGAILGVFLIGVPAVLSGVFGRASAVWHSKKTRGLTENLAMVLGSVSDPLIHARMQSVAGGAGSIAAQIANDDTLPKEQREGAARWCAELVEKSAALCIALNSLRESQAAANQVVGDSREADTTAGMLRDLDALYMRTLERLGTASLDIRDLQIRMARAHGSGASLDLKRLASIAGRLGDEGEAWAELRSLETT